MKISDISKDFHLQNITPVEIPSLEKTMSLKDRFFFIGSCFSEYLFRYLKDNYFHCTQSPFGNTYNPLSIAHNLSLVIDKQDIDGKDVFEHDGLYRHFAFHTKICAEDKSRFITRVNTLLHDAVSYIQKTTVLVITFGTAFAFFLRKTNGVVNNCHTLPGRDFIRTLVKIDTIAEELSPVISRLKQRNRNLIIVFTLSPVRHLRDSAAENSLSKAVLRCAIDRLLALPDTYYFPSYEIMIDELRDYRYYGNDLCHPNELSIRYIMKQFCENCLDREAKNYLEQITHIKKACMHKPRHPDSAAHKTHLKTYEEKLSALRREYPDLRLPMNINEMILSNNRE